MHSGCEVIEAIKEFPREGDEQYRLQEFVNILHQADKRCLEELLGKRIERSVEVESQIENCDRKIIQRKISKSNKHYNLTQTAYLLKVHRQTLYYWIKKGWFEPKRESRNYPVCSVLDIENIIKWRNSVKKEGENLYNVRLYSFRHLVQKS